MFERIVEPYRGSVVVVVGAGGIGGEIIRLVRPLAGTVFAADHNESALAELARDAAAEPPGAARLVTQTLDVRSSEAVNRFAARVSAEAGAPHYFFYTAGILTIEPFLETTAESWERSIDVNLNGAFFCAQAMARLMVAERRGSILLLSSIAGIRARSGSRVNPVYNASKAGLSALVNGAAMQLRKHGVRINCVSPGPAATRMMDVQPPAVHAAVNEIMLDGRQNDPAEVAELALFVAAHGRFTGEDLGLGGGAGLGG